MRRTELALLLALSLASTTAFAGEEALPAEPQAADSAMHASSTSEVEAQKSILEYGLIGLGVAFIVIGGAFATGLVQSRIGPAIVAACAEDRKYIAIGILLLAFPETILILSIGIAYLLMKKIA